MTTPCFEQEEIRLQIGAGMSTWGFSVDLPDDDWDFLFHMFTVDGDEYHGEGVDHEP